MRNYSSNRAQRGKVAYRTPSVFRYQKTQQVARLKAKVAKRAR